MLMTKDVKLLSLQVIAGKFAMEERDIGGSTSNSKDKIELQGTALKLKKFLKLISSNGSDEELEDEELVLMSSMMNFSLYHDLYIFLTLL